MIPVSTSAGGLCLAFPDVCLVPSSSGPVPLPFPNIGMLELTVDTAAGVYADGAPLVVETSVIPSSTGDEAGTLGGVASGTTCGPVRFMTASSKVYAKGKRVVLLGAVTSHNDDNAVGQQVAPSQSKVLAST